MKKYLPLIILFSILISGCGVQERIRDNAIEMHTAGFKDGVECAELAVERGFPISYCYQVLIQINKQLKEDL